MQIDIRSNLQDVMRDLDAMERLVLPKALHRSVNRIGNSANKLLLREVAKEAGIAQKQLNKRGFFSKFHASLKSLTYTVRVKWGAIPIKDFNPRQTKKGVTAKVWGTRQVYDGAFIVDSLGRHVFARKTDKRLPIKKLYGPVPAKLAEQDNVEREINNMIAERIVREVDGNIRYYAARQLRLQRGR